MECNRVEDLRTGREREHEDDRWKKKTPFLYMFLFYICLLKLSFYTLLLCRSVLTITIGGGCESFNRAEIRFNQAVLYKDFVTKHGYNRGTYGHR